MIGLNRTFSDYTADEFTLLIAALIDARGPADYQDRPLEHFIDITAHPSGSDLIYHPAAGSQETPERILQRIAQWRNQEGLEGLTANHSEGSC